MSTRVLGLAAVVLLALLAGCTGNCTGSQGYSGGSGGQQGVCNAKDHFSYGIQGTKGGSESYDWQNSLGGAVVQWGGQGTGSVEVKLTDGAGNRVYDQTFQGGQQGSQNNVQGAKPGTWKVELAFTDLSGQFGLNINAQ